MLPWIVSVDDHVVEPPDLFEGRLASKWREVGPRVVRKPWEYGRGFRQAFRPAATGPETDFWVVDEICLGIPKVEAAAGFSAEEIGAGPIRYDEMRPGCYRVKERLDDMDLNSVERSLCFPNIMRFAGQLFYWLRDKELGLACVQAYNDWMVEGWAGESGGRLLPLCLIPLWDAQLAAAEVRRNAARGVKAVAFSELPSQLGLPSIHDRDGYWLPFFAACDETETVICIHIGSSSTIPTSSEDSPGCVRMATISFNAQLAFTDWLFSGLLIRFPNLKLAFSESQIGWMPYALERMDRIWRVGNATARIDPSMTREPSSYMAGRVFGCFFEDTFGVEVRDRVGVDQITFEVDYPHQDSTWPHTYEYITQALNGIPPEEAHKIVRGNAIGLFGLEPELTPATAYRR